MINQDTACMFACCYDNKDGQLPAHAAKPAIFQYERVGSCFASFFQGREGKIGSTLVKKAIEAMVEDEADEVVLETEITNKPALKLYENLGFVRDKRLFRYYLNGVDASRLKLWLR